MLSKAYGQDTTSTPPHNEPITTKYSTKTLHDKQFHENYTDKMPLWSRQHQLVPSRSWRDRFRSTSPSPSQHSTASEPAQGSVSSSPTTSFTAAASSLPHLPVAASSMSDPRLDLDHPHRLSPAPFIIPEPGVHAKSNPPLSQTLWQKALDSIPAEDKVGVDFQTGGLLHNLIHTTEEKKQEIEANRWVYRDSNGDTVSYADRFLTLLNKYAGMVDIAIQHDPHVVALVWSGFRFLLQVRVYTK